MPPTGGASWGIEQRVYFRPIEKTVTSQTGRVFHGRAGVQPRGLGAAARLNSSAHSSHGVVRRTSARTKERQSIHPNTYIPKRDYFLDPSSSRTTHPPLMRSFLDMYAPELGRNDRRPAL